MKTQLMSTEPLIRIFLDLRQQCAWPLHCIISQTMVSLFLPTLIWGSDQCGIEMKWDKNY